MIRALAIGTLLALLLPPATALAQLAPVPPVVEEDEPLIPPDPYDPATTVDLTDDRYRRFTVGVLVEGKGPFPFVVDTAANRSVLSRELASFLAVPAGPIVQLHDLAGVGPVETVRVDTLSVGGRDLSDLVAPILPARNLGAQGILGLDALPDRRVDLDIAAGKMTITPAFAREPREPNTIVVRARLRAGQLIMTNGEINGTPVAVVIDTGAESSVGNLPLLRRLSRGRGSFSDEVTLIGVTGRSATGRMATIDKMRLGGIDLVNFTLAFADLHSFRQFELDRRPALLIGMDVLRTFDGVALDFARKRVRFRLKPGR